MNAKERVLTTIAHREPDRVPVGEWGIDHDHVSKILNRHTYFRNRRDTTIALWENRRDEVVQGMIADYTELAEKLDYEVLTVSLVPPKSHRCDDTPRMMAEGYWRDRAGHEYRYAPSNDSIMSMSRTEGKDELSDADVENAMRRAEAPIDESRFEWVDAMVRRFGRERAILFRDVNIHDALIGPFGGGFEHELIVTATAGNEIKKLHESVVRANVRLAQICKQRGIDIMMMGHDYCMNSGTIVNPDILREVFFPVMKRVNAAIAETGLPSFFHCCGNTYRILDDFVAAGYQGYQSIQVSAGLDNAEIKRKYGDKLTLWTGVQCETLVEGTIRDVEREVRQSLKTLMPGGGFIFGSTNSVQFGAKTGNYLRALDIVREEGVYGR